MMESTLQIMVVGLLWGVAAALIRAFCIKRRPRTDRALPAGMAVASLDLGAVGALAGKRRPTWSA